MLFGARLCKVLKKYIYYFDKDKFYNKYNNFGLQTCMTAGINAFLH